MLKLLVVDDEKLNRDSLIEQLCWEEYGISTILSAKNGFEAIEIIKNEKPDLLVTDVKMPGMSGLELVENSKPYNPEMKAVFVSGYNELDYIKRAMKLKAYDYIMKPVNTSELNDVIKRTINDIYEERNKQHEMESLITFVKESEPLISCMVLEELIYCNEINEKTKKAVEGLNINAAKACHLVVTFEIDDYMILKDTMEQNDFHTKVTHLWRYLDNIHSNGVLINSLRAQDSRCTLVFSMVPAEESKYALFEEEVYALIRSTAASIENDAFTSVTVGIGTVVNDMFMLHNSYNHSCTALQKKFFYGKGRIYKNDVFTNSHILSKKNFDMDQLNKYLLDFDFNKAGLLIDSLFNRIEAEKVHDSKYVQNVCMALINRIHSVLLDMKINIEDIFGYDVVLWDLLLKNETVHDMHIWVKDLYKTIIEFLSNRDLSQHDKAIEKALQYIQDNYMYDISLKDIANELHYSTNYLGNLFKKVIKKGYRDYLAEYRIRKASELFKQGHLKIYEVSEKVGYKNVPSFIKKFKSVFLTTPAEFRERC